MFSKFLIAHAAAIVSTRLWLSGAMSVFPHAKQSDKITDKIESSNCEFVLLLNEESDPHLISEVNRVE